MPYAVIRLFSFRIFGAPRAFAGGKDTQFFSFMHKKAAV
jgi:hypothetical protein